MFSIISGGAAPASAKGAGATQGQQGLAGAFAAALAQAQAGEVTSGQGLAAGQDAASVLAGSQLAAVNISPALRVITDGQMDVGSDALLAFAQQQGLSPEAIQALRLQLQGSEVGLVQAMPGNVMPPSGVAAEVAGGMLPVSGQAMPAGAAFNSAASVLTQAEALPSGQVQMALAQAVSEGRMNPQATSVGSAGTLAAGQVGPGLGGGGAGGALMSDAQAMAQLLPGKAGVAASATTASASQHAQLLQTLVPVGVPAAQVLAGVNGLVGEAARVTATPASTEQALAQAPQMGVAVLPLKTVFKLAPGAASAKQAASTEAVLSDALILEGVDSSDVSELLASRPAGQQVAAHAAAPASASSAPLAGGGLASPASPLASQSEAQAKYEAVSQKLGEAIGQRMQAQVQRGEWQLSLRLRPQELGSIDVQLGMRAGDLVASFQASSQVTREMLQDQMPRLREMLSGAGIDVASAGVGSQLSGRSGGNSTPSRDGSGASAGGGTRGSGAGSDAPIVSATTALKSDDDGLDLWA